VHTNPPKKKKVKRRQRGKHQSEENISSLPFLVRLPKALSTRHTRALLYVLFPLCVATAATTTPRIAKKAWDAAAANP
jgi:hypothetical protein